MSNGIKVMVRAAFNEKNKRSQSFYEKINMCRDAKVHLIKCG